MKNAFVILMLLYLVTICDASDYASVVISPAIPFGSGLYDEPNAILGPPSAYINGDKGKRFACSLVYCAYNISWYEGQKTVVTLGPGRDVIVGFDHKVADDVNNPYGIDFIVFGNSAFGKVGTTYLYCDTNMELILLSDPAYTFDDEPVTVSVAQDPNGPWYTFSSGPYADSDLFPTNSFAWEGSTVGGDGCMDWGNASDPLKPVDPNLGWENFDGLNVSQAITLYDGSAGGTGFDLQCLDPNDFEQLKADPQTGRRWIQYVKLSSDYAGEIDAISDVAACGDYQHPIVTGDINQDCRVDLTDFMLMAQNWMVCTWMCD